MPMHLRRLGGWLLRLPARRLCSEAQQQQQRQAPLYTIGGLTPDLSQWRAACRVMSEGELYRWRNELNEGQLYKFLVADAECSAWVIGFGPQALQLANDARLGAACYLGNGRVVPVTEADLPSGSEYKVMASRDTCLWPCEPEVARGLPPVTLRCTPLQQLLEAPDGQLADVLAVLQRCGDLQPATLRNKTETFRRQLLLADPDTGCELPAVLWGSRAADLQLPDGAERTLVALKDARLRRAAGECSLSVTFSTTLLLQPSLRQLEPGLYQLLHD